MRDHLRNAVDADASIGLQQAARYFLRLAGIARGYWSSLVSLVMLGVLLSGVGLTIPLLTKVFIDDVYPHRDASYIEMLATALFLLSTTSALLGALRAFATQYTATMLSGVTTLAFFNHLQHQPVRFFDTHRVGELTSRFGDVRSSLSTLSRVLDTALLNGLYLVVVPPILFMMQWKLALLSLAALPITTSLTLVSGRALRRHLKRVAEARAELTAYQTDVLSQIRTIKLSAAERSVYEKAHTATKEIVDLQGKATSTSSLMALSNGVVRSAAAAVYSWYAWHLLVADQLTFGEFIAFSAYLGYVTGPVGQLASLFAELQQSSVALARMFEYLDASTESDAQDAYSLPYRVKVAISGPVVFDRVKFGYQKDRLVLEDVTFRVDVATVTALVGRSGAGKSSIVRLLAGIDPPSGGDVSVSGVSISNLDVRDLRRQLAVVWQEVGLIRGTIVENLTLGCADVKSHELENVLEICELNEFVSESARGLQTPIGEWGATISGGQRQRIGLARALLRNTPILAMDEATSNLDEEMEHRILLRLFDRARHQGVATIVVSHRSAILTKVDQVVLVEDGRASIESSYPSRQPELELSREFRMRAPQIARL